MTELDARVELALSSGYTTAAASRTWTDVTSYVTPATFNITRGRQDERGQVTPSTCTGLVLDNIDGRFTPENVAGAYYPNIKKGRPLRVRVRYPAGQACNFLTANQASFETNVTDWTPLGSTAPTRAQSNTHVQDGAQAMLVTWGVGGIPYVRTTLTNLVVGRQYTMSAYVWVPTGSPNVLVGIESLGNGAATAVKDAFVRITHTFVATSNTHRPLVAPSAAVAGQVWVDAVMVDEGAVAGTFTTAQPVTVFYDRFTGYVDDWGVAWPDGGDTYATAEVAASSRTVRLASNAPLRSVLEEEILLDSPTMYYTLGEAEGAVQAGNGATTYQEPLALVQAGVGGTLAFGASTGPGTDGLAAPLFTRAGVANGLYLRANIQTTVAPFGVDAVTLEASFNTGTVGVQTIATLYADNDNFIFLGISATGKLTATASVLTTLGVVSAATVTSAATVANGATHTGSVRVVLSGGTAVVSLNTDGVTVTAGAIEWPSYLGVTYFPGYIYLFVGGPAVGSLGDVFNGTLAHPAVYAQDGTAITDARLTAHYTAGSTGFSGESSDTRIRRYAGYAGIPAAEVSTETGLALGIAHLDTTGVTVLDAMDKVRATEDGLIFDGRDGTLTFQSRSHRYNAASSLTLDVAAQEVGGDLAPKLDDQGMVNDLTGSRPGGITVRSVDTASRDEYGYYRDTLELLSTSDSEVQSAADWRVSRYSAPRVKIPKLSVDLVTLTTAKIATFLSLDLGSRITLANAPTQASAASQDLFIEGTTESISGVTAYDVSLNVSPVVLSSVWQLDSSTYSVLDTSTLLAY